jgi:toxin-antitoxin system PIN domain toxin
MSSLRFPDVNVWLAILAEHHEHRESARKWWESELADSILFVRLTHLSVLRLLTTSAAMDGKPLTMAEAWAAYDRLYGDSRVGFLHEPTTVESRFRSLSSDPQASPKLWADIWLLACAQEAGGRIVTFDRALAARSGEAILLS